jgi:hypothetical protein
MKTANGTGGGWMLAVMLVASSTLQLTLAQGAGWQRGRVTYYGAPERIARAYDPSR